MRGDPVVPEGHTEASREGKSAPAPRAWRGGGGQEAVPLLLQGPLPTRKALSKPRRKWLSRSGRSLTLSIAAVSASKESAACHSRTVLKTG